MNSNPSRRRARLASRLAVAFCLGAVVATPLLPIESAGADGCAPGWTQVRPYINNSTGMPGGPTTECELVVTESGDVTIPSGIGKVDVLVVGGGGGGGGGTLYPDDALCNFSLGANSDCSQSNFSWAGGGGGGGVEVCKGVDLSGTVSVTVGAGGAGAVAATYPAVTEPTAGDGEATTLGTCTTPGGKGGGSSVSIGGVRQNGSGGASGNGNAGNQANVINFSDFGGGGGGAGGTPTSAFQSGGRGKRATGGCFSGTSRVEWGGGGGAAPGGNNLYWTFDEEGESSVVWLSGATVNNSFSGGTPALAGPPNSGMGGGGGMQTPPYKGSDAILQAPIAYDGGDGGSGVVILRYTLAGAPTINGFSPVGGPTAGGETITIFGSGFVCGPEVTIGGEPCPNLEVLSETQLRCNNSPAGAGAADVVVTTTGGTATAPTPYCFDADPTACTDDTGGGGSGGSGGGGGGGGGDTGSGGGDTGSGGSGGAATGGGTGAGEVALVGTGANRSALPATGLNSLLALAGTASLVLGSSAVAISARRRRSDTTD